MERWRERLAGLEGPAVRELDRDLCRLVEGGAPPVVPPDMERRVDSVAVGAAEASDRGYTRFGLSVDPARIDIHDG